MRVNAVEQTAGSHALARGCSPRRYADQMSWRWCLLETRLLAGSGDSMMMMDRRKFLVSVWSGLLAAPLAAEAQQADKVYRIGVLSPFSPSFGPAPSFEAFRQTFRELGYVDGRNVVLEYQWADGRAERLPDLAAELIRHGVDLIFSAWGTPAALATKKTTRTVPIVFAGVGDAVGVGLVASLARPGGNATGSTFITEDTIAKQLELLKAVVPRVSRVGVVVNPSNPVYGPVLKASEAPARALGLHLAVVGVQRAEDLRPPSRPRSRGTWADSWSCAIQCFRSTACGS